MYSALNELLSLSLSLCSQSTAGLASPNEPVLKVALMLKSFVSVNLGVRVWR